MPDALQKSGVTLPRHPLTLPITFRSGGRWFHHQSPIRDRQTRGHANPDAQTGRSSDASAVRALLNKGTAHLQGGWVPGGRTGLSPRPRLRPGPSRSVTLSRPLALSTQPIRQRHDYDLPRHRPRAFFATLFGVTSTSLPRRRLVRTRPSAPTGRPPRCIQGTWKPGSSWAMDSQTAVVSLNPLRRIK